ncbi:hypothetical protein C8J56DRAFT_570933 [Mycena floridula]|nr:hypothetical protein C8J56DRAFT_570933 [Mycena floridula]
MPSLKAIREQAFEFVFQRKRKTCGSPWLDNLLLTANVVVGLSGSLPFPYVGSCATLVVFILQRIKNVKRNQNDFRDLLIDIVAVLQVVRDATLNDPNPSTDFCQQCTKFTNYSIF